MLATGRWVEKQTWEPAQAGLPLPEKKACRPTAFPSAETGDCLNLCWVVTLKRWGLTAPTPTCLGGRTLPF